MTDREQFIKNVRKLAMENYDNGGDYIVECFTDEDIVGRFCSMAEVRRFIATKDSQRKDADSERW